MVERANRTVREETDSRLMLNYQDAVNTINEIVSWYNTKRRHSSLHYLTPRDYYRGDPEDLLRTRQFKIDNARKIRKERNMLRIRLRSDNMSMEKHLYRGRVKGGGVFNPLLIPEVTIW